MEANALTAPGGALNLPLIQPHAARRVAAPSALQFRPSRVCLR
ncbi:hypothetical protein BIWAKO_05462 [Bosea sp. BIWAKO-01]|nr:hypothetical protein BIWAKO_05462 [Bosea sp. BIWAKO-01]